MFFNFALEYASEQKNLNNDFVIDNDVIADFRKFLKIKEFTYKTRAEMKLDELEKIVKEEKLSEDVKNSFQQFKESIVKAKESDFERDSDLIK